MRPFTTCTLLAALAVGLLFAAGCQQQAQQPATEAQEQVQTEPTAEETAVVDPVCGMETSRDSEYSLEMDGTTYYFCSEECMTEFVANPEKYLPSEE